MTHPITGTAMLNSQYASEQAFKQLKVSGRIYAPFFADHMQQVSNSYSIVKWADKVKPRSVATLSSAYTAGGTSFVVAAHTIATDYRKNIIPDVTEISTPNGAARYRVRNWNPGTRTITIEFVGGTDSNLAIGTEIKFNRVSGMADKPISANDAVVFGGGDYNYWSYFNYNFEVADDMLDGTVKVDINEFKIDHQIEMNMDDAYSNFEHKIFHDPRIAGTGATARIPDGNNQGGYLSRAGGILPLGRARGLYEVDSAGAAPSLNMFRTDVRQLRLNMAFQSPNAITRDMGITVIKGYVDKALYPEVAKLAELLGDATSLFSKDDKLDGILGVSCRKILVDDVVIAVIPTDGLGLRSIFYETDPDCIKVQVRHFMRTTDLAKDSTSTRKMAENSFTVEFPTPWQFGLRTNIGSL